MQSNGRYFRIIRKLTEDVFFVCVFICFFFSRGGSLLDKGQLNPTWFSLKYM